MLKAGDTLPDLTLKNTEEQALRLHDFLGQYLVIYFYPKDNTPGCTMEACEFRDNYDDFEKEDARVFGISGDSVASHQKFAAKLNLNFDLLSDPKRQAEKAFGVPRNLFGLLPGRVTFVFNRDGKLLETINSATNPRLHQKQALKTIQAQS